MVILHPPPVAGRQKGGLDMAITLVKGPVEWTNKYYALSTDVKPVGVPIGSRCVETDTGNVYETADGTNWFQLVV